MTRTLLVALCLAACGPEEIIEDRRYRDLPLTSGGDAPAGDARVYLERGMALIQEDQCERAIDEAFEPALALFEAEHREGPLPHASRRPEDAHTAPGPEWSDAMYLHAFCLVELGRTDEAALVLERALERIPNDVVYACELGHIRQAQERLDDALALFVGALENVRALAQSSSSAEPLFGETLAWWERRALRGIGFTHYERDDLDAAETAYRAALAIDPGDDRALRELQLIATRRGAI